MKLSLSVCFALLSASAVCQAQAPFRVEVSLVNVGFSVRDAKGNLVTNLSQDDFEISEDGVPQKIAFFARSLDVPLTLGLIMDVSGSQQSFVKPHLHDLEAFLKTVLEPADRAFLVCFGNRLRLMADHSNSAKDIVDALKYFHKENNLAAFPLLGPVENRVLGTAFYDAIYYSATQMMRNSAARGRRALIVFSDGEDNSSAHHMLDAIEAAQANDVLLFTIRYTEIRDGRLNARNKYGTSVMDRIARETGGAEFDGAGKGMVDSFRQIGEQLRSSFELGYHTSNPPGDGTFHKIAIKSKVPGLTIRAKTGYYAR